MARFVKLPRQPNYGNVGLAFDETKPPDDKYLFGPEATQDVWAAAKALADVMGYAFYTDGNGDFQLQAKNNPTRTMDLEPPALGGGTLLIHPNAYAGTYVEFSGAVGPIDIPVNAARIDLILPLGPTLGSWQATVLEGATPVAGPITINPAASGEELHYYDHRTRVDGTNACVVTLYSGFFGAYTVRLQSTGAGTTRQLDALALWAVDAVNPLYPAPLATDQNALQASAQSANEDQRNYVIVVGQRRAAVTDSEKLGASTNNPSDEFIVSAAIDVQSVLNPYLLDDVTPNPNYVGMTREALIYDNRISDRDFSEYVSRTFIYRYRLPNPAAPVSHTLLPSAQLRDPVHVVEDTFDTLDEAVVRFVTQIRHQVSMGEGFKATTELETTPFPEYPSYELREDVDIDRFGLPPIINFELSYQSLDDTPKTNVAPGSVHKTDETEVVSELVFASGNILNMAGFPWPPAPGTVFLTPGSSGVTFTATPLRTAVQEVRPGGAFSSLTLQDAGPTPITSCTVSWTDSLSGATFTYPVQSSKTLAENSTNAGYWYEFDVDTGLFTVFRSGLKSKSELPALGNSQWVDVVYQKGPAGWQPARLTNTPYHHLFEVDWPNKRIDLKWQQGDGSSGYARPTDNFLVEYRQLGPVDGGGNFVDPYGGSCPFYDPYSSEIGHLVKVKFDALITGLYRVSVCSAYDDTVVAWLTNAETDPEEPEAHWQYLTAGTDREFVWDGVDQLGDWNARQSAMYGDFARGAFPTEERPQVGKGYYVWNREERGSDLALISGRSEHIPGGKPLFGQGTYAEWYILIEATSDRLEEIEEEQGIATPRTYSSKDIALVYTHLPHPTRVAIDWADWVGAASFDPDLDVASQDASGNWLTRAQAGGAGSATTDAVVNNQKPTRIRFQMEQRPGLLWVGKAPDQSVRVFRVAHLRRNTMDQFVEFGGINYAGKQIEQRRLVSRRSSNDDHTFVFADEHYRHGKSFKTVDGGFGFEWIFRPELCEKDFRGQGIEPLEFADYLQLEEVPSWDQAAALAGRRSRFQIGFLNDLFYLSVFTEDRSGRYQWCLNPFFVDKSKILTNAASHWYADSDNQVRPTKWADDPILQHRRTVLVRQWTDELVNGVSYASHLQTAWGSSTLIRALAKHYWDEHSPEATAIGFGSDRLTWAGAGDTDFHSLWHKSNHKDNDGRLPSNFPTDRQLGTQASTRLGSWTWESGPTWVPSITRDFHGYYCVPPMADPGRRHSPFEVTSGITGSILPTRIYWPFANFYAVVYVHGVDLVGEFTGDSVEEDAAMQTVWQSPVQDMTETYSAGDGGKVRFHSGATITSEDTIDFKSLDYSRQDSLVHYEELRGTYTRGPKPQQQPKKLDSVGPYYQNVFTYGAVSAWRSIDDDSDQGFRRGQGIIPPRYETNIQNFFSMSFRSEYVWESAGFFPVTDNAIEAIHAYNWRLARLPLTRIAKVRWDSGAWTGWKDEWEYAPFTQLYSIYRNIFDIKYLPWAPCNRLPQTTRTIFHLVLLNERREVPV